MIERIYEEREFSALPEHGIEAQKIRALWLAYGGAWDFCRFFRQGSGYIAALDGSFVLCNGVGFDSAELSDFFLACGYSEIICSVSGCQALNVYLKANFQIVNVMICKGGSRKDELPPDVQPGEIWSIIEKRFSPAFEPWYLDMSHRVRHGVTRCYSNGKSALVLQHDINGEALISQVCVLPEEEGKGFPSMLLKKVCGGLDSDIFVICEDDLCGFYEKNGFIKNAELAIITPRD